MSLSIFARGYFTSRTPSLNFLAATLLHCLCICENLHADMAWQHFVLSWNRRMLSQFTHGILTLFLFCAELACNSVISLHAQPFTHPILTLVIFTYPLRCLCNHTFFDLYILALYSSTTHSFAPSFLPNLSSVPSSNLPH